MLLQDSGRVHASGGDDTVRVWRLADGTPLAHPLDLSEPVWGDALHGNIIVTAVGGDIAIHQPAAP
jgi:hypothetical protein